MINGKTQIYGIIGDPIKHTLSPLFQNQLFSHGYLNAVYVPFHVKAGDLREAIIGLRALNVAGFNVTVPHKESIIPFLDQLTPQAKAIGAVNTVSRIDDRFLGHNTDGDGFLLSLRNDLLFEPAEKKILILGAGGTAKAIAYTLNKHAAQQIDIFNRTVSTAEKLINQLKIFGKALTPSDLKTKLGDYDLIINATSLGISDPIESALSQAEMAGVKDSCLIYDVVYSATETSFIHFASEQALRHANGLGMLAGQGALAFEYWTERPAAYSLVKKLLDRG